MSLYLLHENCWSAFSTTMTTLCSWVTFSKCSTLFPVWAKKSLILLSDFLSVFFNDSIFSLCFSFRLLFHFEGVFNVVCIYGLVSINGNEICAKRLVWTYHHKSGVFIQKRLFYDENASPWMQPENADSKCESSMEWIIPYMTGIWGRHMLQPITHAWIITAQSNSAW